LIVDRKDQKPNIFVLESSNLFSGSVFFMLGAVLTPKILDYSEILDFFLSVLSTEHLL